MNHLSASAIFARILIAAVIGMLTFVFVVFALRPYGTGGTIFRISGPEWFVAAALGIVFFLVAVWRFLRGAALEEESGKFLDAISEAGDRF